MAYTSVEINRISGSRLAIYNRQYLQDNGDIWVGTADNRLKRLFIKDKTIGVELEGTDPVTDLRTFISNILLPGSKSYQVEVDFGEELYKNQKEFVVQNDKVTRESFVVCSLAYDAPTNKQLDELEMDSIDVKAGTCSEGSFRLLVTGQDGSLRNKFKINYKI